MITNALQKKAYDIVGKALPFSIDPAKVTVEADVSYIKSTIKIHDYAAGIMSAFGSVVEHLGVVRGLPAQTLKLNRRRCGFLINSLQLQFLNGYSTIIDTFPIAPDNGIYRTKDGRYVAMIMMHPHLRDALLEFLQCPNSARGIQAAVEKKTAQEIEDELGARDLPCGIVRSPEEWHSHPQGAATVQRQIIDFEQKGNARKRVLGKARYRPLEGVRVLELSHMVAGPTIGRLLAEQGADVIKLQPPVGDWMYPVWMDASWGKKNILLDIKGPNGKKRFVELLASADVLVDSLRPTGLANAGFDEKTLLGINPNLVHVNMRAYPKNTAWENRRGFEQIAQALSGIIHVHSEGMPEPTVIATLMDDYLCGYLGATAAIAALAEREEKGGYWGVWSTLTGCATPAPQFVEPLDAELYAPVTMQDLVAHAIDQVTPFGTFTRIAPAVEFSHTPSMAIRPTNYPGTDPDTIGWTEPSANGSAPKLPHYPSRWAREGAIRNLVSCYGIEDRGDGKSSPVNFIGGLSLASKQLREYAAAHRW
jgi:crotonobetainyl-CoA:carnitine CoA-transferase CaiB-like acyl-CoA transferase